MLDERQSKLQKVARIFYTKRSEPEVNLQRFMSATGSILPEMACLVKQRWVEFFPKIKKWGWWNFLSLNVSKNDKGQGAKEFFFKFNTFFCS